MNDTIYNFNEWRIQRAYLKENVLVSTIHALELKKSTFDALELGHPRLKTCAHELDNSRWGAVDLDTSKYKNGWKNQVGIREFQLEVWMDESSWN